MQAKGIRRNTGSPSGGRGTDQLNARERQVRPYGVAERLVLLMKPGNAGGGKGPQLKADAISNKDKGIGDEPGNPISNSQTLWTASHAASARESFPRAGCGKSACPVRRAGTGNRVRPNRTEAMPRKRYQKPPGD